MIAITKRQVKRHEKQNKKHAKHEPE